MAARGETQADVEVSTLVVPAWRLRWRAPELALVLGERALALASSRHDEADRLRAESLVVFAGNRVGRSVRIADRALDALKAAEKAGEHRTAWLLRVELAACARSVGAPLTGFAAVTPVLEAPDVPAELRASALVQASECLVTVGRGDEPTLALAEADQLYVADTTLDEDMRLVLRGLIRAVQAAQHRRWGDIAAAIGAAREGLDLLSRLIDTSADSGQAQGRLTLELVLALMDANRLLDASDVGTPMLERPVRAPGASTSGWLRLALASRVHLPAGRVAMARDMLRDAAVSAERHQLDTLLAESLLALAHVHEVSGELADALTNLRSAHAAERRRARAVYAVRARLAAEFSGVHRQPADLHQQLADLLRPVEGMPKPSDGILPAALKQQLRQWRPVQVRKGDGLKVKRVRRAAEDMTVEGLSAARAHAADRWRMVQPFGEPEDKTPEPIEPIEPPPAPSPTDRTVPASGLIASAGAMVSGRRRAARVAAGEIDESQPTTTTTTTAADTAAEPPAPQLNPEQERRRKVEQQLMELQREARRQIEAERQARAEERAKAERDAQQAAEEAARQAAAREEAARQEAARQESARADAARREADRQDSLRAEAAQEQASRAETSHSAPHSTAQSESVLDMLKAQGLRAGGRRRARDSEAQSETSSRPETSSRSETPSWRVDPPSRLRDDDYASAYPESAPAPEPSSSSYFSDQATSAVHTEPTTPSFFADASRTEPASPQDSFGGAHAAPPDRPNYFADENTPASPDMPDLPGRSGLAAAFSRPPASPDFGPHLDDPVYPLSTPAAGFPAPPAEPKLPELDFSSLDFGDMTTRSQLSAPKRSTASIPSPEPAEQPDPAQPDPERDPAPKPKPLPSIPDPVPSVPTPDEIPHPPEPDLLSNSFLSAADVDDDIADLPTGPVKVQSLPTGEPSLNAADLPAWATQAIPAEPVTGTGHAPGTATDDATQPDAADLTDPSAHTSASQSTSADGEPPTGALKGRPSSRRRPSDMSLADLLAEALVAYETGRRSDEEQLEATDLASAAWSSADAGQQQAPAQSPLPESQPDVEWQVTVDRPSAADSPLPGERHSGLGVQFTPDQCPPSDQPLAPHQSSALDQQFDSDWRLGADRQFGAGQHGADRPATDSQFDQGQRFGVDQRGVGPQLGADQQPASEQRAASHRAASDRPFGLDQQFAPDQRSASDQPLGLDQPTPRYQPSADQQPALGLPASDRSGLNKAALDPPASGLPALNRPASGLPAPGQSAPEAPAEKTGPIVPVGAAPDNETTGPIRRVRSDGNAQPGGHGLSDGSGGWTLPGT